MPTCRSSWIIFSARRSWPGGPRWGCRAPTDVELEYLAQARSDHCNHNTFRGRFHYRDEATGETFTLDNPFKVCIEAPTREIARHKDWVVSVLWDNAGVGRFDDEFSYVIKGETHNSPSNLEAYGGSLTGIVGVYRDPLGTGKGARLIGGMYGFCVGPRDYAGPLKPRLHPRRLLDGVIEGVKDGGNKSGVPTVGGALYFDPSYLGKCLVFVAAAGLLPREIRGEPGAEKAARPGDLIFTCGGRVGQDGIHGVTASSEVSSPGTPAGHVQIGDPYTQKNMHDFLLEARDQGLITFITDCGGGGLSSAVGESAGMAGGGEIELAAVPLKYQGLNPWEIWVSESQERMVVAVAPEHEASFKRLARQARGGGHRYGTLHRYGRPGCQVPGPHRGVYGPVVPGGGVSPLGVRSPVAAAGEPPDRAGSGRARGSPGFAPGHAGPPQYLLPGVDHPPVRSRGPGGQRAQTPGGRGGAGAGGRRGAAAPARIRPGGWP